MNIKRIRKSENAYSVALPDAIVKAGDRLLVTDTAAGLKGVRGRARGRSLCQWQAGC